MKLTLMLIKMIILNINIYTKKLNSNYKIKLYYDDNNNINNK